MRLGMARLGSVSGTVVQFYSYQMTKAWKSETKLSKHIRTKQRLKFEQSLMYFISRNLFGLEN